MAHASVSSARKATFGMAAATMLAVASLANPAGAAESAKAAIAPAAPTTILPVIPKKHCNYLFDRADVEAKARGKGFISPTTKRSLIAFYAFDKNDLPTCTGPREIAWERDTDFDFLIALGDSGTRGFNKAVDFNKDYGFKPARRPTTIGPVADLRGGEAAKPAL